MITAETIKKINTSFRDMVAMPNNLLTQYDNQKLDRNHSCLWCRLNIVDGETEQTSLGDIDEREFETVGVLIVQLFAPLNTGEKAIRNMAEKVCKVFMARPVDGIDYDVPYVRKVNKREAIGSRNPSSSMVNDYWQLNVICPFSVEEQG